MERELEFELVQPSHPCVPHPVDVPTRLLYRTDDHRLMIVPYSVKDEAFVAGKPREWTGVRLADTGVISNFDVHSDGTRVLALLPADRDEDRRTRNQATIVLNFNEEIRRRVGGGLRQAGGVPPAR